MENIIKLGIWKSNITSKIETIHLVNQIANYFPEILTSNYDEPLPAIHRITIQLAKKSKYSRNHPSSMKCILFEEDFYDHNVLYNSKQSNYCISYYFPNGENKLNIDNENKLNIKFIITDRTKLSFFHINFFISCFYIASAWHVERKGISLHSSCLLFPKNTLGVLFLGDSGAGKSTVVNYGALTKLAVLGDDLNFLFPNSENTGFDIQFCPSIKKRDYPYYHEPVSLKGIFSLVQDNKDYTLKLSPLTTTQKLYEGFLQAPKNVILTEEYQHQAFQTCCTIARKIPGYELHFTKSAKFLDVIKAEFPDAF